MSIFLSYMLPDNFKFDSILIRLAIGIGKGVVILHVNEV